MFFKNLSQKKFEIRKDRSNCFWIIGCVYGSCLVLDIIFNILSAIKENQTLSNINRIFDIVPLLIISLLFIAHKFNALIFYITILVYFIFCIILFFIIRYKNPIVFKSGNSQIKSYVRNICIVEILIFIAFIIYKFGFKKIKQRIIVSLVIFIISILTILYYLIMIIRLSKVMINGETYEAINTKNPNKLEN